MILFSRGRLNKTTGIRLNFTTVRNCLKTYYLLDLHPIISKHFSIMIDALSPLDGRYASHVSTLRHYFSEAALMRFRAHVEVEWLIFMSEHEIMPNCQLSAKQKSDLRAIIQNFSSEDAHKIKEIERSTNHDVKAIEYFLKDTAKTLLPESCESFWHFACTSEDINNLAYALMLKNGLDQVMLPSLTNLEDVLASKTLEYQDIVMLSRTHGQTASPTTLGKEIANVLYRLQRQIKQLKQQDLLGKFHGAVGNLNAHVVIRPDLDWQHLSQQFVEGLGLTFNPMVTQIEPHDFIAELSHTLSRINTILIDFARDMWTYISLDYFKLKVIANEVGSSTMPHKVNPIDFENAEGNFGMANALFTHFAEKLPISRLQRDLTDSTVLRNLGVAFGYSEIAYRALLKGLSKVSPNLSKIADDLNDRYEVLTEALQTVLRYHGVKDAYEQMKAASRGQAFTQESYLACVKSLDLPETVKTELLALTPAKYVGLASRLSAVTKSIKS